MKIDNVLLQEEFRSFNDAKRKNAGISSQAMSVNILNSKIDGHHLLLFVSTEYYFPRHSRVYAPSLLRRSIPLATKAESALTRRREGGNPGLPFI